MTDDHLAITVGIVLLKWKPSNANRDHRENQKEPHGSHNRRDAFAGCAPPLPACALARAARSTGPQEHVQYCKTMRCFLSGASSWLAVVLAIAAGTWGKTTDSNRRALLELYNSTEGAGWVTTWAIDTDPCDDQWFGVNCLGSPYVYELVLNENGLRGSLPNSIGDLTHNMLVSMKGNHLRGTIPASLSNMAAAFYVDLSNNNLTSSIPEALGGLSQLQQLWLNNNRLSGDHALHHNSCLPECRGCCQAPSPPHWAPSLA